MHEAPNKSKGFREDSAGARLEKLILFCCVFLIVLHLGASFFPGIRLWGINQLHYFPLGFRLAVCAAALAVLIPGINRTLVRWLTGAFVWVAERFRKTDRYLRYAVLSLLTGVAFWLLRVASPLLGDGYLRAGELRFERLLEITEPLDFYLHLAVYRLFGLDGLTTYAVLSCVAGAVFVFLVFLWCDLWGKGGQEKLLVFSMLITVGAVQLFFGYVESYSLMYVSLAAYALAGLRYLKRGRGFVWPCVLLALAGGFHLSAFSALPSLFYLAFVKPADSRRTKLGSTGFVNGMWIAGTVLAVALGMYFLMTHAPEGSRGSIFIHPFGGEASFYSFFSLAHLLDFVNHQLLISPVGVALLPVFLISFRKRINPRDRAAGFLASVAVCSIAFALFVDPKLGYARDWDLFAFAGLGVTLLSLHLLLEAVRSGTVRKLGNLTLALAATALVSTMPWILVNAYQQKAVARLEDLLKIDHQRAAHGYETLACVFRDKGDHSTAARFWKKAIAINPNPRYFGALGNAYTRLEEYDKAIEAYKRCLEAGTDFPSLPGVYSNLGNTLVRLGRYEEAVSYLKEAISLRPGQADYYFNLGNILGRAGRYAEAIPYFEMGVKLNPNNTRAYKILGITYARVGKNKEAKRYLEEYLRLVPKDAPLLRGVIDSIQIEIESGR